MTRHLMKDYVYNGSVVRTSSLWVDSSKRISW
jgi:hypothetical protein